MTESKKQELHNLHIPKGFKIRNNFLKLGQIIAIAIALFILFFIALIFIGFTSWQFALIILFFIFFLAVKGVMAFDDNSNEAKEILQSQLNERIAQEIDPVMFWKSPKHQLIANELNFVFSYFSNWKMQPFFLPEDSLSEILFRIKRKDQRWLDSIEKLFCVKLPGKYRYRRKLKKITLRELVEYISENCPDVFEIIKSACQNDISYEPLLIKDFIDENESVIKELNEKTARDDLNFIQQRRCWDVFEKFFITFRITEIGSEFYTWYEDEIFLPEDDVAVILGSFADGNFSIEYIDVIEEEFAVQFPKAFFSEENLKTLKLKQVVDHVYKNKAS